MPCRATLAGIAARPERHDLNHDPRGGATAIVRAARNGLAAAACIAVLALASLHAQAADTREPRSAPAIPRANVAFFDGAQPPVGLLQAFDAVVLDPARGFDPSTHPLAHSVWFARVPHAAPGAALAPAAFVAQHIEPLWRRGYRGFLLDAPDAIASIDAIRATHPDARLIVGGDDALRAAQPHANVLYAVLGQSLVRGFTNGDDPRSIRDVAAADRTARVDAAQAFMRETHVPVLSLEICPRTDRACARTTAAQVVATGVTPYVTGAGRDVVGIGALEVLPRKVLIVQNRDADTPLDETLGVRDLAMPLNYLGYDVEYADLNAPLPADIAPDRYAGVVAWIEGAEPIDPAKWQRWVDARIADHLPIAFMGRFGFDAAQEEGAALDLQPVPGPLAAPVSVVMRDPMMGFEIDPKPDARDLVGMRVGSRSRPLLRLSAAGANIDAAAITPWGGYTLSPYTVVSLNGIGQTRWAIQPISFVNAALRLVQMPSPSVTTENGRRLVMTHVDGDGYASRVEFPGADYSGDALYQRIFTRYKVPMTLSVIEGEVGPSGLYPKLSPRLEALARQMFALPWVQIGSHTYSHPFQMADLDMTTGARVDHAKNAERGNGGDTAFSLNIPGYTFNLDREIAGSIDYIDSRLAPPGKRTEVLQWPGDCEPPAIAVRKAYAAGVQNINGGDTIIRKSVNSWTHIAPIGVDKGPGAYQVYAPNQDENIYTNNWLGPFYGFTQVLETYDMTEHPFRFKPIDIYYHMYSGTKIASLQALDRIYSTVLKQPVLPVYITDYTHKVLDWRSFAVAREVTANGAAGAWVVRGNGDVRELHWPRNDAPNLRASPGVTGYAPGPDGTYIHVADGAARVVLGSGSQVHGAGGLPYIAEANGFVRHFRRTADGMSFEFGSYYQPFVKLGDAQHCRVSVAGQAVAAQPDGAYLRFETAAKVSRPMSYRPVEIACGL
ncbi:sugar ABC transporter [Burkholderia pyrrocinia]